MAFLPPEDYHQIYDGIWGYNALLAMAAASCVFFPFSPVSFVAGVVNTVATVAIQQGLRKNMDQVRKILGKLRLKKSYLTEPFASVHGPHDPLHPGHPPGLPGQAGELWGRAEEMRADVIS